MSSDPHWLSPAEDRAWRSYLHAHHQLGLRLHQRLLHDSGLTEADYQVLAVLSVHPAGRMPAQELCGHLRWEKSRLSHQVRRMEQRGQISREPNPADARSAMVVLLPAGRRAVDEAAPGHVHNVRRLFVDLLSPAELAVLTEVSERVLGQLAEDEG